MSLLESSTAPAVRVPMPASPGLPSTGSPELMPSAVEIVADLLEAGGVGEAGHADLAERALGTVAEHAADQPAFGDR